MGHAQNTVNPVLIDVFLFIIPLRKPFAIMFDLFHIHSSKIAFASVMVFFFFFFFGCIGSLLLHAGFLSLRQAGAALCCGARASHCGGFSCCGARALGVRASVVVACGL